MNQNEYKSEDLIKLSEAGDVDAQSRLGTNYLIGRDNFPVDYEEGVKWLEKAAESGHSGAQTNLAYC
ncbi:MAG: sel1 repeat family protein, partial [Oscillospiraceae bacterium]|nr:sel1 repeat family protein [Oscillospiraceae bacterium]